MANTRSVVCSTGRRCTKAPAAFRSIGTAHGTCMARAFSSLAPVCPPMYTECTSGRFLAAPTLCTKFYQASWPHMFLQHARLPSYRVPPVLLAGTPVHGALSPSPSSRTQTQANVRDKAPCTLIRHLPVCPHALPTRRTGSHYTCTHATHTTHTTHTGSVLCSSRALYYTHSCCCHQRVFCTQRSRAATRSAHQWAPRALNGATCAGVYQNLQPGVVGGFLGGMALPASMPRVPLLVHVLTLGPATPPLSGWVTANPNSPSSAPGKAPAPTMVCSTAD